METKIGKKKPKSKLKFYIDSAKFLIDTDRLTSVNIPNNIIEIDADTGEELREFKRKSLKLDYKGFHIYIANYIKVLKGKEYNKFMMLFSAKVSKDYFSGITKKDFIDVLNFVKSKGYIDFDDVNDVVSEFRTKDTDITFNYIISKKDFDDIHEFWRTIKEKSIHTKDIRVGKSMIQFGSRGSKYFFKVYDKNKEITKDYDEFMLLPITEKQRQFFLDSDKMMLRIEITVRNKRDYDSLGISNKVVDLWQLFLQKPEKIANLVRKYYDKMTGRDIKKRDYNDLTPQELIIVNAITLLKEKANINDTLIADYLLSGFETKQQKYRARKKLDKLVDYAVMNEEELMQTTKDDKRILEHIENMFFLKY